MHVLITGGAGFVGANLVDYFNRNSDARVRVLDNESLGKREHLAGLECEFIEGDIRDDATLRTALEGIDCVVHLAADTRVIDSIADPTYNFDVNVVGSMRLLLAMRAAGVPRLVNASTGGAILGEAPPPVNEDMVPRPTAPYGASKLAVEGYCSAFFHSYGLSSCSLRFSNVYGPRSFHKGSVVATFIRQIRDGRTLTVYGDGSQTRDYVYVDDLCAGIAEACRRGDVVGTFQLGTGKPTSLNELIELLKSVASPIEVNVHSEGFRRGEIKNTFCDISKAKGQLGYSPVTPLSTGLRLTWDWFEAQGER